MIQTITSQTRVFALLGDPVAHASSPLIQNAAMRNLGLDGVYVALPGLLGGPCLAKRQIFTRF